MTEIALNIAGLMLLVVLVARELLPRISVWSVDDGEPQ